MQRRRLPGKLAMHDVSARMTRVEYALERSGTFRPLSEDPNETWLWQNHDLANLIENRLNVLTDPFSMTDGDRELYGPRVTSDGLRLASPKVRETLSFWILDGQRRVGTVAVLRSPSSEGFMRLSSLYVLPAQRARGHATRVLTALHEQALKCGLSGTLLSTEWSWQRAIRFYLKRGMWVWGFRHAIEFAWHRDLPRWQLEADDHGARFTTSDGSSRLLLIEAGRRSDRLEWVEQSRPNDTSMAFAPGTFALSLATRGWPLVTVPAEPTVAGRSNPHRGGPAELAAKIRQFEARDRRRGWHVDTPQIPGLDYSDGE